MKIREVRTRVGQWSGKTTPLSPHFCTNPMDLLSLPQSSSMSTFTFHSWLVVEVTPAWRQNQGVYASRLYSCPREQLAFEAQRYKSEGYRR
jgi:hypothetical protein